LTDRRNDGLECLTAAPCRPDGAAEFLGAGDPLHRRRVVLTQLAYDARPQLRRVALEVIPAAGAAVRRRTGEDQRPCSFRSRCGEEDGGRAALAHTEKGGLSEAGGIHDGLDLGRSFVQRANFWDGVRQPHPGLVEQEDASERAQLLHKGPEFGHGPIQLDVAGERPGPDKLDGPVAEYLIRQAEIAAGCVQRFRHGMSVLLIPPLAGAPVIVRSVIPSSDCPGTLAHSGLLAQVQPCVGDSPGFSSLRRGPTTVRY
jgi:hypothetical protein